MEVKSFANRCQYQLALGQTATYAHQLGLTGMTLVLFIEEIDDDNRRTFETPYVDATNGVTVNPMFVVTGTS